VEQCLRDAVGLVHSRLVDAVDIRHVRPRSGRTPTLPVSARRVHHLSAVRCDGSRLSRGAGISGRASPGRCRHRGRWRTRGVRIAGGTAGAGKAPDGGGGRRPLPGLHSVACLASAVVTCAPGGVAEHLPGGVGPLGQLLGAPALVVVAEAVGVEGHETQPPGGTDLVGGSVRSDVQGGVMIGGGAHAGEA